MPDYRLYFMDPHSGHIDRVEDFHSGDDVEASLLVQRRAAGVPMELWTAGRKVMRVDAAPETATTQPIRKMRSRQKTAA
jgi:hypothetical protein